MDSSNLTCFSKEENSKDLLAIRKGIPILSMTKINRMTESIKIPLCSLTEKENMSFTGSLRFMP